MPGKKILVVEDSPPWQERFRDTLSEEFGAEVTVKDNKRDALEQARKGRFDLYITDNRYALHPGGETENNAGIEFYNELREIHPEARAVLITTSEFIEKKARKLGMDYMNKGDYEAPELAKRYPDLLED